MKKYSKINKRQDGEIGANGQDFTLDDAKKFINSFKVKSEVIYDTNK